MDRYILLADDDADDQDLLQEAILNLAPGTHIRSVWNGQRVLSFLDECPDNGLPSLLILDYQIPPMDAYEILTVLSRQARYAEMAKVVWSSSSQTSHINNCLGKGALKYFLKPNDTVELRALAGEILAVFHKTAPVHRSHR
jgi:CheY-like chemotaxis protein